MQWEFENGRMSVIFYVSQCLSAPSSSSLIGGTSWAVEASKESWSPVNFVVISYDVDWFQPQNIKCKSAPLQRALQKQLCKLLFSLVHGDIKNLKRCMTLVIGNIIKFRELVFKQECNTLAQNTTNLIIYSN